MRAAPYEKSGHLILVEERHARVHPVVDVGVVVVEFLAGVADAGRGEAL
jgi:predicted ATPase